VGNQFRDRHLREWLKQAREAAGNENWKAVQNLTNKTILPFDPWNEEAVELLNQSLSHQGKDWESLLPFVRRHRLLAKYGSLLLVFLGVGLLIATWIGSHQYPHGWTTGLSAAENLAGLDIPWWVRWDRESFHIGAWIGSFAFCVGSIGLATIFGWRGGEGLWFDRPPHYPYDAL